jgi:hypothetical protein
LRSGWSSKSDIESFIDADLKSKGLKIVEINGWRWTNNGFPDFTVTLEVTPVSKQPVASSAPDLELSAPELHCTAATGGSLRAGWYAVALSSYTNGESSSVEYKIVLPLASGQRKHRTDPNSNAKG